jgi:hypothetical protein
MEQGRQRAQSAAVIQCSTVQWLECGEAGLAARMGAMRHGGALGLIYRVGGDRSVAARPAVIDGCHFVLKEKQKGRETGEPGRRHDGAPIRMVKRRGEGVRRRWRTVALGWENGGGTSMSRSG